MSIKKTIDVIKLKKVFRIENGNLERANKNYSPYKWTIVTNRISSPRGYCKVSYDYRVIFYHTIIWILCNNKDIPLGLEIDHINGNKIDNTIDNLRVVTKRENNQNKYTHRNGAKVGASYTKKKQKYRTQMIINQKNIHIGYFKTEEEAHKAYLIACTRVEEYIDNASFRDIVREELSKQMGIAQ